MKLFPFLAATLLQDTEATCSPGDSIFVVTCHADLVIELGVNHDCLTDKFPNVHVTELQIDPSGATATTPTDECVACTAGDAASCSQASNFWGWDFSDSSGTHAAVTDSSTNLFFKAGHCGSSMTVAGGKATFTTAIGKPATVDSTTGIVTQATIMATDITCEYPDTIPGVDMDPSMTIVADAAQASDKITQDANPNDVSEDLFSLATSSGGSAVTQSSTVTLGDAVSISVAATDSAITDFYLYDCTATNGKTTGLKSLPLVRSGCMSDLGALATDISATMTGKTLTFNQFAFADASQTELTLDFDVTCSIMLGTAPDDNACAVLFQTSSNSLGLESPGVAGRRRRSTQSTQYEETTEYTVAMGNKIPDVHSGIVVAHKGEGKTTSGAVTNAVALIAGTAIMLL